MENPISRASVSVFSDIQHMSVKYWRRFNVVMRAELTTEMIEASVSQLSVFATERTAGAHAV